MQDSYKTIRGECETSFTEKKSEFIGSLRHVDTPDEAIAFISEIKNRHKAARHYCYAYICRKDNTLRYSDDGEPQGKAAIPMLEVLNANELTDVCLVVTRYFGGILLGGGGLARAYSKSAAMTVAAADRVSMELCVLCDIVSDYSLTDKIRYALQDFTLEERGVDYSDRVVLRISIIKEEFEALSKKITDVSKGKAIINITDEKFHPIARK